MIRTHCDWNFLFSGISVVFPQIKNICMNAKWMSSTMMMLHASGQERDGCRCTRWNRAHLPRTYGFVVFQSQRCVYWLTRRSKKKKTQHISNLNHSCALCWSSHRWLMWTKVYIIDVYASRCSFVQLPSVYRIARRESFVIEFIP